jgi:hypothetical protein
MARPATELAERPRLRGTELIDSVNPTMVSFWDVYSDSGSFA